MNGAMLLVPISSDEAARLELQLFDKGHHMHQGRAERFIRLVFVFHPLKGAVASKRRKTLSVVAGCSDGRVLVYSSTERNAFEVCRDMGEVTSVASSPDGRTIAIVTYNHLLFFFIVETNTLSQGIDLGESFMNEMTYAQEGETVAVASEDGSIRLVDVASQKLLRTVRLMHGGAASVAFAPSGGVVVAGSSFGHLCFVNVGSGDVICQARLDDMYNMYM